MGSIGMLRRYYVVHTAPTLFCAKTMPSMTGRYPRYWPNNDACCNNYDDDDSDEEELEYPQDLDSDQVMNDERQPSLNRNAKRGFPDVENMSFESVSSQC